MACRPPGHVPEAAPISCPAPALVRAFPGPRCPMPRGLLSRTARQRGGGSLRPHTRPPSERCLPLAGPMASQCLSRAPRLETGGNLPACRGASCARAEAAAPSPCPSTLPAGPSFSSGSRRGPARSQCWSGLTPPVGRAACSPGPQSLDPRFPAVTASVGHAHTRGHVVSDSHGRQGPWHLGRTVPLLPPKTAPVSQCGLCPPPGGKTQTHRHRLWLSPNALKQALWSGPRRAVAVGERQHSGSCDFQQRWGVRGGLMQMILVPMLLW